MPEAAINFGALAELVGAQLVELTPDEEAAVERVSAVVIYPGVGAYILLQLMALGFDRERAVEAFMACDKNEELAANYLFEGGWDDAE